jgi:cytochrome c biogenesis protein CcdA/thiol-disulfide isomerase/thioredoxin
MTTRHFFPMRISLILAILLALVLGFHAASAQESAAPHRVDLYQFWGEGCPYCEEQIEFLRSLQQQFPSLTVHSLEVWRESAHRDLFRQLAAGHGVVAGSVPTVFVGGSVHIGDGRRVRLQIESVVQECVQSGCPDPLTRLEPGTRPTDDASWIDLPFLGSLDLAFQPLLLSTVLIALVDGFNPCSLWVLTVLLALVIHSGSRSRIALVGVTFLTTTALVYGLFIVGVFGALSYIAWLGWVQWLVASLAFVFAVVNIKDYFWFQKGVSFTIPAKRKPGIHRSMRGLLQPGRSPASLVAATVAMALGIALVELPCTAGFPVVWSGLVAAHQPGLLHFAGLVALYLLLYLLIELVVFLAALKTLKASRFEERHGRLLKLGGGMIMLVLALVLAIAPEFMNRLGGIMLVFAAALGLSLLVLLLHRRLLPRLGVHLGDGW